MHALYATAVQRMLHLSPSPPVHASIKKKLNMLAAWLPLHGNLKYLRHWTPMYIILAMALLWSVGPDREGGSRKELTLTMGFHASTCSAVQSPGASLNLLIECFYVGKYRRAHSAPLLAVHSFQQLSYNAYCVFYCSLACRTLAWATVYCQFLCKIHSCLHLEMHEC